MYVRDQRLGTRALGVKPLLARVYGTRQAWNAIARAVKDAANWTCQECGAVHGQPHPTNGKNTVMTCAHLGHDEANVDPSNLRSWCAPCHLRYDAAHHAANAAATRLHRQADERQMGMEL
jgi:hypothetical protein